ncbi:MAG TPA: PfkB family carbohydrate kinase [Thermodesulfobacteriota bacterium]|nr:PfkB family carbohydrate kinase [Thermodesulfobacteriota bacterium]
MAGAIVVVGSVAYDSVETPFGRAENVLGGSATYFSTAASFFAPVRVVAVVGDDFPDEALAFLRGRPVDLSGLQRRSGKTFRWVGRYGYDLNEAQTLETQLNVFADFRPQLPEAYRDTEYVFLANIDPELQMEVLHQVRAPRLVAADTMNFWIAGKPAALRALLARVDLLIINEAEARQLAGEASLVRAARAIRALGPRVLIVKRGEYGALMFHESGVFAAPGYPLETVFDPTGAGDTFAGGVMGWIARAGRWDEPTLRQAIIAGSVLASYNVEAFSLDRLRTLTAREIEARYEAFRRLAAVDAFGA